MPVTAGALRLPDYEPGEGCFDEAFAAAGEPRAGYRELLENLDFAALAESSTRVAAHLRAAGVTFGEAGEFVVDPVPRLLAEAEWSVLAGGLEQRARALNLFIADAYGERHIVEAGVVPERALLGASHFEPGLDGLAEPGDVWANVVGIDLIRDATGRWLVLEDNARTPSGIAYAAAAREAMDAEAGLRPPPGRREADEPFALLLRALQAAAPEGRPDPLIVVLTDGPGSAAHFEHAEIARRLGVELVTPDRLASWRGGLMLRGAHRRDRVDVVYRRTDEDRLTGADGKPTALGEMLFEPWRRGRLGCVNGFGTGVADDKLLHAYVEDMIRFYLNEEPRLPSVPTYDLGREAVREEVLDRIDELVIKPRDGYGGRGIFVGPHATDADRRKMAAEIRNRGDELVAQETMMLSSHPTLADGSLEPRHVDLRPFVYVTPSEATAAPGGLTRVALRRGSLVVNSSQAGGAKDTWVIP
jgi:carboxylate-amine ligase